MLKPNLIVVLGPTASGKTSLAIKLASKFNGEIVSADSRQIYKGMDIGTAKSSKKEQKAIPHHLIDIASVNKKFSVKQYQKLAYKAIDDILHRGKTPFLVGGTAYYIYSLVEGWHLPTIKKDTALQRILEKKTAPELLIILKKIAPERAKTIEAKNKRRLIRAIEIAQQLGAVPKITKQPKYTCLLIGLKPSNNVLKLRIEKRVKQMIKQGLEKEVKTLIKKYGKTNVLKETIGYVEWQTVWICDDRHKSRQDKIIHLIESNTWRFVKKQMTWFKRDKNIVWLKNETQANKLISSFLGNQKRN